MSNQANRVRMARQALANAETATGVRQDERVSREPTEREKQLRLFYQLARRMPLSRQFSDAVDLGIWCVSEWRSISPRVIAEADRERVAIVVSDMWRVLEEFEETGEPAPLGHGPILLGAFYRAWRLHRLGRSA